MRIWFLSDTHCEHQRLVVPAVDAVIHCGDESTHGNAWMNEREARQFFEWYTSLTIPTRIFVPGNHSTAIEQGLIRASDYPEITFLIHESVELHGFRIFGSPFTPQFYDWAYMKDRSVLDTVWQSIPDKVDILITHGPPKGILDVTADMRTGRPINVGSKSLMRHVTERIKPRIHAFGHIHDEPEVHNFGTITQGATQFINCACCEITGRLVHHGQVIEISPFETSRD
jgi:Icc-related predicted phosphoesterase